ncbi:MAG: hypothetical protein JWR69_4585 [Pedosphaera sp.]|nr:hypothetical protein [Pedosphaera sp.]
MILVEHTDIVRSIKSPEPLVGQFRYRGSRRRSAVAQLTSLAGTFNGTMKTRNYQNLYRRTYATLGINLRAQHGFSAAEIAAAEKKLGLKLPTALRDYYLVAGRESSLNHARNRFYALAKLETHSGKLVFMEENQWVVIWGITASSKPEDDPAVYQGPIVNGEPSGWYLEERKISVFLVFMLHLQAAYGGGMACTASGPARKNLVAALDKGWHFGGEVNGMRTYSKDKKAVCFLKWQDSPADEGTWRVFAGACEKEGLEAIATELNLKWD